MMSPDREEIISGLCVVALSKNLKLTTALDRVITQNGRQLGQWWLKCTDFCLTAKFNKMQETNNSPQKPPLQQTAVRCSAFDKVRKWDNEQLRTLLKEVKEMGKLDAPKYFKQSDKMKQLFELEKADYYTWADQFSNVQRAIEVEILWRVSTDAW
jgi:hypothetical protein